MKNVSTVNTSTTSNPSRESTHLWTSSTVKTAFQKTSANTSTAASFAYGKIGTFVTGTNAKELVRAKEKPPSSILRRFEGLKKQPRLSNLGSSSMLSRLRTRNCWLRPHYKT